MNWFQNSQAIRAIRWAAAICTLSLLCGCVSWTYQRPVPVDGSRWIPRRPNWAVGPHAHGGKGTGAFAEVRLYESVEKRSDSTSYRYVIFWPSGHLLSVNIGVPTNVAVDYGRWNAGSVGYYELSPSSNMIAAQVYAYSPGRMKMVYQKGTFRLDGKTLLLSEEAGAPFDYARETPLVQRRAHITLRPDW